MFSHNQTGATTSWKKPKILQMRNQLKRWYHTTLPLNVTGQQSFYWRASLCSPFDLCFTCIAVFFTHASSLNLMIFQSRPVSSFQRKPIKQWRCWHMRWDVRRRINYVPQNVYKDKHSSARLEEKEEGSWDMVLWMNEHGVSLIHSLPALHTTPSCP